jgi:histone deacetylase 8
MRDYVCLVAGASMTAARALRDREADVACSWTGGRHHARKEQAAGYCYVNDIVLAVGELRKASLAEPRPKRFNRILYLDVDLHAGDGPNAAFHSTPNVLTLSMHHHAPGFYPSCMPLDATGPAASSPAAHHALNIAIPQPGASAATLLRLFESCVVPIRNAYAPDAVILQLGVDGLAGDPNNEFNYSLRGVLTLLAGCLAWRLPSLLLGGGGYHHANTARAWTACTALAAGLATIDELLDLPVPETVRDWPSYAPDFTLDVPAGKRADLNTEADLVRIERAFEGYAGALRDRYGPASAVTSS